MQVDHVVVLMLENRSFDHMLGFLDHVDGISDATPGNPGWDGGEPVRATPNAKPVLPFGPDHSHDGVMTQLAMTGLGGKRRATNQGFVRSYERKARGLVQPQFGGLLGWVGNWWTDRRATGEVGATGRGPLAMLCQSPDRVPVLAGLAAEFAVCDRWFCSVPGETWPNRNFVHAATSDGETQIEIRPYTDRTIFEVLDENGSSWHIYHDDTPQVWAYPRLWNTPARHANWYRFAEFGRHVAAGRLPAYSFIEPNHRPPVHAVDHDPGAVSNSQHPENNAIADADYDGYADGPAGDFARGEALIASVYESLRANPELFARTVLIVTYDEHGGLYDHVAPPTGVPAPGDIQGPLGRVLTALWHRRAAHFDFTMCGPRVPTVVISPYIPPGTVDHDTHEHACVPATLRALFAPDAPPLTARDRCTAPLPRLLSLPEPRTDLVSMAEHATVAAAPPPAPALAEVPEHYRPFAEQAELVRQELVGVAEPEVLGLVAAPLTPAAVAGDVTTAFAAAAARHRDERGH